MVPAKLFAQNGRWQIDYGPEPTFAACRCPLNFLAQVPLNQPDQYPVAGCAKPRCRHERGSKGVPPRIELSNGSPFVPTEMQLEGAVPAKPQGEPCRACDAERKMPYSTAASALAHPGGRQGPYTTAIGVAPAAPLGTRHDHAQKKHLASR